MWLMETYLISGMMVGLEFVPPEDDTTSTALVLDLAIIRIIIYRVNVT